MATRSTGKPAATVTERRPCGCTAAPEAPSSHLRPSRRFPSFGDLDNPYRRPPVAGCVNGRCQKPTRWGTLLRNAFGMALERSSIASVAVDRDLNLLRDDAKPTGRWGRRAYSAPMTVKLLLTNTAAAAVALAIDLQLHLVQVPLVASSTQPIGKVGTKRGAPWTDASPSLTSAQPGDLASAFVTFTGLGQHYRRPVGRAVHFDKRCRTMHRGPVALARRSSAVTRSVSSHSARATYHAS
jgi:hypothetical protein